MPQKTKKSITVSKYIVYIFFIIYLIVLGVEIGLIEGAPVFISYLSVVCFVGVGVLLIAFIMFIVRSRRPQARQDKSLKRSKFSWKQSLFLIIFILSFVPLLASLIDQGQNSQYSSIHNSSWNGCSTLRGSLEDEGFDTFSVQTDLSATLRLEKPVVLVLMGPNQFYNPIYEIPFFREFLARNNSLLVCHDHGATSYLFYEIALASPGTIPITIFPDGILRDNESYVTNPSFPLIVNFHPHPTTQGISEVLLSRSGVALGGKFIEAFGWTLVGESGGDKYKGAVSFVDKNGDKKYNRTEDGFRPLGALTDLIDLDLPILDLGGYAQAVFMAHDASTTNYSRRIFVSSDASLFNNELINSEYDNKQFAINIFDWLTFGKKSDYIIAFDEAHIRPEETPDVSSAGIFGLFLGYIIHLSTNPLTAFIYPLLGLWTFNRYLPREAKKEEEKKEQKQEEKEEILRFRTSSYFARKINWYKENRKFGQALTLLYRRLERRVNALLKGRAYTAENIINAIIAEKGSVNISRSNTKRLHIFFKEMILIKENKKKIKDPQTFQNLFFEMEWVLKSI